MSSSDPEKALIKRSADNALMPPPPPPKKIKRPTTVLPEDTYTGALSHIIARDYFPGLLETDAQQEYLSALDSGNDEWIAEAGRKLTEVMTPVPGSRGRRGTSMGTPLRTQAGETPRGWAGETPLSVAGSETGEEKEKKQEGPKVDLNLSLGAFQAKYTSEDNESFNALLDKQNQKHAEKYSWIYNGNKILSGRQIAYRDRETKLLEASHEPQRIKNNDRALIKRDPEKEADTDTRKAMVDVKISKPRNSLMFTPDSIEDTHVTRTQAAEAESNAPPKQTVYANTRMPPPPSTDDYTDDVSGSRPPSPTMSAINDAIRGRPRAASSVGAPSVMYAGSETPRVNGYAFVDEEDPEPEPTPQPAADRSLLERLGVKADGGPNPFKIHEASRREDLHHRMVDRVAKQKRESAAGGRLAALKGEGGAGAGGKTPTPKFASSPAMRRGNLTPAAQRLFERVGTPRKESGYGDAFGGGGKTPKAEAGKWTPRIKRGA